MQTVSPSKVLSNLLLVCFGLFWSFGVCSGSSLWLRLSRPHTELEIPEFQKVHFKVRKMPFWSPKKVAPKSQLNGPKSAILGAFKCTSQMFSDHLIDFLGPLSWGAKIREVLHGVGADGVGVKFPIFAVNCCCLPLSFRRSREKRRKRGKMRKKRGKMRRKRGKSLRPHLHQPH